MLQIKHRGIVQNYLFNLIYQIFTIITPLITAPYISRVLGTAGVGRYSFVYSVSYYFILIGTLGFSYYAQREIAALQKDKEEQSKVFFEIVIARFITVGITAIVYSLIIMTGIYGDYTNLMWIMTIGVVSVAFDITFFFQGNDIFDIIVLRNVIIRCFGIACVFLLIKGPGDVWKYALYQVVIGLISTLSLWPSVTAILVPVKIKELNFKRHFAPSMKLFLPTIAISIYTMLDRFLIGVLVPGDIERVLNTGETSIQKIADVENGYYEQSEKIVKMAMTLFTSLTTVLVTRNSDDIANGDYASFKKSIYASIRFLFFIGMPITAGIAAVAQNLTLWFFGEGYEKTPFLMMIFSPIVIIIGISNILGRQYLIPLKRDKHFTIAIWTGAIINVSLNLILIPKFLSYGAAIASVAAETMVTAVLWKMASSDIDVFKPIKESWKSIVAGTIMFFVVFFTQEMLASTPLNTVFLILEGTICYFVLLKLSNDDLLVEILRKIKELIQKREKNNG